MKVLALDTCTRLGSIALMDNDETIVTHTLDVTATFSERLLPSIDRSLADAGWRIDDVDLIACAKGPGSFTGLRIGMATAKGLAFAASKPLIGVNSLEAAALGLSYAVLPLCIMLDARKRQVFAALFQPDGKGGFARLSDDESVRADDYAAKIDGECLFAGNGADMFAADIRRAKPDAMFVPQPLCYPRAAGVALLGQRAYNKGETGLEAHYVRATDAEMNPKFIEKE